MEPKLKRRALVGYHDGSKSVLYYNADIRKVLTSQNFCFLDPSDASPEQILIMPNDVAREGESGRGMWLITCADPSEAGPSSLIPQKRHAEDNIEESTMRRTRGKRVDYKHLADPFSDDEAMNAQEITNLLKGNDDDCPTLN